MEPPFLSSLQALALHWKEVLRRDGFRISSGNDVLRGEIHHQHHLAGAIR